MNEKLNRLQKQVAHALFEHHLSEEDISNRFGITPQILQSWLAGSEFQDELDRLRENALNLTRDIIARNGPVAAERLAQLLESDKPDVARRAALDLIDRCLKSAGVASTPPKKHHSEEDVRNYSEEKLRRAIITLAEGMQEEGETP